MASFTSSSMAVGMAAGMEAGQSTPSKGPSKPRLNVSRFHTLEQLDEALAICERLGHPPCLLLLLNRHTFAVSQPEQADRLAEHVRAARDAGVFILTVHDEGAVDFESVQHSSPDDLVMTGLYKTIAVPLHTASVLEYEISLLLALRQIHMRAHVMARRWAVVSLGGNSRRASQQAGSSHSRSITATEGRCSIRRGSAAMLRMGSAKGLDAVPTGGEARGQRGSATTLLQQRTRRSSINAGALSAGELPHPASASPAPNCHDEAGAVRCSARSSARSSAALCRTEGTTTSDGIDENDMRTVQGRAGQRDAPARLSRSTPDERLSA